MSLSINNNLMALNTARHLNSSYSRLSVSMRRLSSGLRVGTAADDAAGLAIRELMRADVSAMHQGIRNANDAISMIQVADGALAVIDEKLIRMKELAEQAATGTYNSTQRLIINSEFQAMASEIQRIAVSTDFNGVKLLDGSLAGPHDGSGLTPTGELKVHFGAGNNSAEDYYYINIGDATLAGLGLGGSDGAATVNWWEEAVIDYTNKTIILDVPYRAAGTYDKSPAAVSGLKGIDFYQLPIGLQNITVTSNAAEQNVAHKPHVCLFTKDGEQLTGPPITQINWHPPVSSTDPNLRPSVWGDVWWNLQDRDTIMNAGIDAGIFDPNAKYDIIRPVHVAGEKRTLKGFTVEIVASQNEIGSQTGELLGGDPAITPTTDEIIKIDKITSELVFMIGGHAPPEATANCNKYTLKIEAEFTDEFVQYIEKQATIDKGGGGILSVETQELGQQALEKVDNAIIKKDKIRAHLGALQNRFENTASNLRIQAENMQAAESRISDADVSLEMTEFVRSQILTQAATAMLAQANSLPRILAGLLEG